MSTFKDALIILLQIAALPVTSIHNSTIATESFFLTLCRSLVKVVDSREERDHMRHRSAEYFTTLSLSYSDCSKVIFTAGF